LEDRQRVVWSYVALLIAVAAAYAPALDNGLVWDDRIYILENAAVQGAHWAELVAEPVGNFHRPVVFLSFALEFLFTRGSPALLHLTNLILHGVVACLVLAAAVALGAPRGVALAAALLFALHPVQSEAVLYVSGRTDVLAAGFGLGALLLHARASGWSGTAERRFAFPGALACFALSLGSKESAALLPLALVVGDRLFERRRARSTRADYLRWSAYACTLAAYAAWRGSLEGEPLLVAAPGDLLEMLERLSGALAAITSYASLLVFPVGLHLERFVSSGTFWSWGAGLVLVACWLAGALWARPPIRFWLAWAAAAYLLTANLIPVYPGLPAGNVFAPEHFLYLPSTGLFVAVALAAATRLSTRAAAAVLSLALLVFAGILYDRAQDWRDEEALYAHTLAYSPDSARVRLNLGNLYLGRGETGHAAAQFAAGLTAHPDDPDLLTNAGLAWLSLGRFAAAEHALQRVVEIEPDDAQAWANLGAVYGTTGRFDAARRAYENALRRDPSNADAQAGIRILEGITPTP
jgi:tetratricopeptide (TPR) repeat protein